jgi:hypothetical protein
MPHTLAPSFRECTVEYLIFLSVSTAMTGQEKKGQEKKRGK